MTPLFGFPLVGLAAGVLLAVAPLTANAASVSANAALTNASEGDWDPFSTCVIPAGQPFIGYIDISNTGIVGSATATVTDPFTPSRVKDGYTAALTFTNLSNSTCTIYDVNFNAQADVLVSFDGPFTTPPLLQGDGVVSITPSGPSGAFLSGNLGSYSATTVILSSGFYSPPYNSNEFAFDAFFKSGDLLLAPGDVVRFDIAVGALATAQVPLPAGMVLLAGALGGLTLLRRRPGG